MIDSNIYKDIWCRWTVLFSRSRDGVGTETRPQRHEFSNFTNIDLMFFVTFNCDNFLFLSALPSKLNLPVCFFRSDRPRCLFKTGIFRWYSTSPSVWTLQRRRGRTGWFCFWSASWRKHQSPNRGETTSSVNGSEWDSLMVCHPVCPTDSSSRFCPINGVCPRQRQPGFSEPFPKKTASPLTSESQTGSTIYWWRLCN